MQVDFTTLVHPRRATATSLPDVVVVAASYDPIAKKSHQNRRTHDVDDKVDDLRGPLSARPPKMAGASPRKI